MQVKLTAIAGTCSYRPAGAQKRQNIWTAHVNLLEFLGNFTCTFFSVFDWPLVKEKQS